jgi:hypothetical protein
MRTEREDLPTRSAVNSRRLRDDALLVVAGILAAFACCAVDAAGREVDRDLRLNGERIFAGILLRY